MVRWQTCGWLVLLAALAGCSGKATVPVGGTVLLDGKALDRGTVTFHPVAGNQLGYGKIQSDGRYTAATGEHPGLAPGEYRVTVVATGEPPKTDPRGPEQPPALLVPAKYTTPDSSGLRYTVPPAGGSYPIELTSK